MFCTTTTCNNSDIQTRFNVSINKWWNKLHQLISNVQWWINYTLKTICWHKIWAEDSGLLSCHLADYAKLRPHAVCMHTLIYNSQLTIQRQYHMSSPNTSICPTFHFLTSRFVSFRRWVSLISTSNCHKFIRVLNNGVLKSITVFSSIH